MHFDEGTRHSEQLISSTERLRTELKGRSFPKGLPTIQSEHLVYMAHATLNLLTMFLEEQPPGPLPDLHVLSHEFKLGSKQVGGAYVAESNVIGFKDDILLGDNKKVDVGSFLGEEIMHWVRDRLFQRSRTTADFNPFSTEATSVSEFFGFIGRRILYASMLESLIPEQITPKIFRHAPLFPEEQEVKFKRDIAKSTPRWDWSRNLAEKQPWFWQRYHNEKGHFLGYKAGANADLVEIRETSGIVRLPEREIYNRFIKDLRAEEDM